VTQVPEYLLERSRARRAALGLGGDAPAPGGDEGGGVATATAPAVTGATPAGAPAAAAPAAAAPAVPAAPPQPDVPLPEYVTDPGPKSGMPVWMMPIFLLIPLWAIVYVGGFGERGGQELTGAALGAQVYAQNCAACHGPVGEGGVGPALQGGESKLTFPDEADHVTWVNEGSTSKRGQPYGDPARGRVATSGGMPGFASTLSPEQIQAVVLYERDSL